MVIGEERRMNEWKEEKKEKKPTQEKTFAYRTVKEIHIRTEFVESVKGSSINAVCFVWTKKSVGAGESPSLKRRRKRETVVKWVGIKRNNNV